MNYLITFVIFVSATSMAQVTEEWVSRYDGYGFNDCAKSIAIDGLGNVYLTGYSYGSNSDFDYVTIKYNSSGIEKWVQRYNGIGNGTDEAKCIALDDAGNVFVTGYSMGNGTQYDYVTIKYNSLGIEQWIQRYSRPYIGADVPLDIAVDDSGNVYVTGESHGFSSLTDYATVKYNTDGVQQWVQRYNGPGNWYDRAYSIAVDAVGNAYVTGTCLGTGVDFDYATIKYNSNGTQQWIKWYNGPGNGSDVATSISTDNAGNIYVSGYSQGSGNYYDLLTIKYSSSGNEQWTQRYYSPGNWFNEFCILSVDISDNVYVSGSIFGGNTGNDYVTLKYSSSGNQLWFQRYSGPGEGLDRPNDITVDASGNVYVTGVSTYGVDNTDYATVKYNSSGVLQWIKRHDGAENNRDEANSLAIDNSGNIYVTGASIESGTDPDYATIKYSQTIGVQQISTEVPAEFNLLQNYPNPFNPETKIRFDIPPNVKNPASNVRLSIFDILGREITLLVNDQLKSGTYEVNWNASSFPSGVYFYRIITSEFSETKKMILAK